MRAGAAKPYRWRISRARIAVLLAIALAACTSAPGLPAEIEVAQGELYEHPYTNLILPARAGIFVRESVTQYDPDGFDFSGHYTSRMVGTTATVYFYPGTNSPSLSKEEVASHIDRVKADIMRLSPFARLLDQEAGEFTLGDVKKWGYHARFELPSFRGVDEPIESHLYLFPVGQWFVKFRVSFPARDAELARPELGPLLATSWWRH